MIIHYTSWIGSRIIFWKFYQSAQWELNFSKEMILRFFVIKIHFVLLWSIFENLNFVTIRGLQPSPGHPAGDRDSLLHGSVPPLNQKPDGAAGLGFCSIIYETFYKDEAVQIFSNFFWANLLITIEKHYNIQSI